MTIAVLGVFAADAVYRAERLPRMGETVLGRSFALGPGGKGSNQAVAAGKAMREGGEVSIVTRLGEDDFAALAEATWQAAGVSSAVRRDPKSYTGAAAILLDDASGDNAIVVAPGAAGELSPRDVDERRALIEAADVFVTQLEQPLAAAEHALRIAREAGATTVLNPAPARNLSDDLLALCDYVTPNETEAELLTGLSVATVEDAEGAARRLRERGAGAAVVTLGEKGALFHSADETIHVRAFRAGKVVETTGAGDAFNGAFAVALAERRGPADAVRFGCAAASISVTRPGAAASSPTREEIDSLMEASR